MVSMKWCINQSKGIKLVEPNENMSKGYMKLAESSIGTMNRERGKNDVFSISAGYYSMYYALYGVMINMGIKCEIHTCTIKFMENFLMEFYSEEDVKNIYSAFKLRNSVQYYVNNIIENFQIKVLQENVSSFFIKSQAILMSLNENKIREIRKMFEKETSSGGGDK